MGPATPAKVPEQVHGMIGFGRLWPVTCLTLSTLPSPPSKSRSLAVRVTGRLAWQSLPFLLLPDVGVTGPVLHVSFWASVVSDGPGSRGHIDDFPSRLVANPLPARHFPPSEPGPASLRALRPPWEAQERRVALGSRPSVRLRAWERASGPSTAARDLQRSLLPPSPLLLGTIPRPA